MRKTQTEVPDDVKDALRRGSWRSDAAWVYVMPQLERKLYVAANEVLARYGATWSRKNAGHVFDSQASIDAFKQAIASGTMIEKNANAFYATPDAVARVMCDAIIRTTLMFDSWCRILEPSCGEGALGRVIRAYWESPELIGVEVDEQRAQRANKTGYFDVVFHGDFLAHDEPALSYDAVIMNPPFSATGRPELYAEHIAHAWHMLDVGGVLASVVPASFEYRTGGRTRWMKEIIGGYEIIKLPSESFKEAGTGVSALVLVATKRA